VLALSCLAGYSGAQVKPASANTAARIANAESAGPEAIARHATILDWPAKKGGEPVVLRKGSNGWTCFADWPETPANDPMCLDDVWMEWMQAGMQKRPAKIDHVGLAYMLQGGEAFDQRDPSFTSSVLSEALVTRVTFEGKRATGVEIYHGGKTKQIRAGLEVVLSLGAINTPKVLMQSGIGHQTELARLGIPVIQHLPGVGQNLQDHLNIWYVWEYPAPLPPPNPLNESVMCWSSGNGSQRPDFFACQTGVPIGSPETIAQFGLPESGWSFAAGISHPKSRGRVSLTGPTPVDPVRIEANILSDPGDLEAAIACVERLREVAHSLPLRQFVKRGFMPGNLKGRELKNLVRDAATTYWHETCTAKMGRDEMSVVDARLKVYGVENLRIADGSIMPRITTANPMAPCVIIGERAAEALQSDHRLGTS
ncbi:MAG TPA: GMC oxidoreductase, partial [Acidobacteriaceae bacterium]